LIGIKEEGIKSKKMKKDRPFCFGTSEYKITEKNATRGICNNYRYNKACVKVKPKIKRKRRKITFDKWGKWKTIS